MINNTVVIHCLIHSLVCHCYSVECPVFTTFAVHIKSMLQGHLIHCISYFPASAQFSLLAQLDHADCIFVETPVVIV